MSKLEDHVFQEALKAQENVYELYPKTPLERWDLYRDISLWVKREDCSPIHSYKWRGAYHAMETAKEKKGTKQIITASAGNHAQGVAASAAFNNGNLKRWKEKRVGHYEKGTTVVYALKKSGTTTTETWNGCDYPRKRYVSITAYYPKNTYDTHVRDGTKIIGSMRWDSKAR